MREFGEDLKRRDREKFKRLESLKNNAGQSGSDDEGLHLDRREFEITKIDSTGSGLARMGNMNGRMIVTGIISLTSLLMPNAMFYQQTTASSLREPREDRSGAHGGEHQATRSWEPATRSVRASTTFKARTLPRVGPTLPWNGWTLHVMHGRPTGTRMTAAVSSQNPPSSFPNVEGRSEREVDTEHLDHMASCFACFRCHTG